MSLIPVMDIKDGEVVAGVEGDRDNYEPIKSEIADSSAPEEVLKAFERSYEFNKLYIADINALETDKNNLSAIKSLSEVFEGELLVDAGFEDYSSFSNELADITDYLIIASESLKSFQDLKAICSEIGSDNVVLSLDFDEDGFISEIGESFEEYVEYASELGIIRLILLDVSQVGTKEGPSSRVTELSESLSDDFRLISGGGVKGDEDYRQFLNAGIDGVLVSTALHEENLDVELRS